LELQIRVFELHVLQLEYLHVAVVFATWVVDTLAQGQGFGGKVILFLWFLFEGQQRLWERGRAGMLLPWFCVRLHLPFYVAAHFSM
jgi:hypothetical protein